MVSADRYWSEEQGLGRVTLAETLHFVYLFLLETWIIAVFRRPGG